MRYWLFSGSVVLVLVFLGAAVAPLAHAQTIRGQVLDQTAHIPLPGAHIIVLDTDPMLGTTTDADGWFVLDPVPLGRVDLQVSFLGYASVILPEVLVTSGKEVVLTVRLQEDIFTGDEVVVTPDVQKGRPLNELAIASAHSFSVEETQRYAGAVDDPARMASAFAGVTTSGGVQTNALVIRGNAPKGVLWRLEGVEIPNPNHFAGLSVAGGGGLTLFSSQLLADSDFFTSAFPAEYGNALAGVFDMRFRTGHPTRREHAVQAGALGLEAASEGPFRQGQPATYLFNYRYSTLGLLLAILPTEDIATYQDLSFKLNFPTRQHGRFSVWGIGGLDRQTGSAEEDPAQWEYETWDRLDSKLRLGVGATGISHDLILGQHTLLHTALATTINQTTLDQQRITSDRALQDDLILHSTQGQLVGSFYLNHKLATRHVNRTGASVHRLFYDLDVQTALNHTLPLAPVAQEKGHSLRAHVYSQSKLNLTTRGVLNVGLHVQHVAWTSQTLLEPRVGLRWQLHDDQTFSLGYGLHSQTEDLRIYFLQQPSSTGPTYPNRDLGLTRAHHVVVGYSRAFDTVARLKVEAYAQSLFDVPVISDSSYAMLNFEQDFTFNEALVNEGSGRNAGIEVTVERFLKDGYYYLLTGSLFSSRYRGGDGIWRSTRFDQRYALNVLFGKEFSIQGNNVLGLNGRLVWMGGQRRSPVDHSASLQAEEVIYNAYEAFTYQEPALFLVDLTVTYRRNHRRLSQVWALQVKNVLGAQEVYPDYNFATQAIDEVKEGFPLPVLSYKIEF